MPARPPDRVDDGRVVHGSAAAVPSRLEAPARPGATVVIVASDLERRHRDRHDGSAPCPMSTSSSWRPTDGSNGPASSMGSARGRPSVPRRWAGRASTPTPSRSCGRPIRSGPRQRSWQAFGGSGERSSSSLKPAARSTARSWRRSSPLSGMPRSQPSASTASPRPTSTGSPPSGPMGRPWSRSVPPCVAFRRTDVSRLRCARRAARELGRGHRMVEPGSPRGRRRRSCATRRRGRPAGPCAARAVGRRAPGPLSDLRSLRGGRRAAGVTASTGG